MEKMILAVDVDYKNDSAHIGGIAFSTWQDSEPLATYSSTLDDIEEYEPGAFFKRELPCILKLLQEHNLTPDCIIVDGFVYLGGHEKPGLGKHLYDALDGNTTIIGVAKQSFKDTPDCCAVCRGESRKPLYVTVEGLTLDEAKELISTMHGEYRIPKLLKLADQLCRSAELIQKS
jgi:deoxyribonuclease V